VLVLLGLELLVLRCKRSEDVAHARALEQLFVLVARKRPPQIAEHQPHDLVTHVRRGRGSQRWRGGGHVGSLRSKRLPADRGVPVVRDPRTLLVRSFADFLFAPLAWRPCATSSLYRS